MSKQIEYQDKVNAEFAEAVYQEMASTRYGIDFCCTPDLRKWSIKKELLDLNALQVDICPDPDNPAQPGDPNFVSGPCGVLDIVYFEDGGSITYLPCDSFVFVTTKYGLGAAGTPNPRICYDKNVGYTFDNYGCEICFQITESDETCSSNDCFVYTTGSARGGGTITYIDCSGNTQVQNIIPELGYPSLCVKAGTTPTLTGDATFTNTLLTC